MFSATKPDVRACTVQMSFTEGNTALVSAPRTPVPVSLSQAPSSVQTPGVTASLKPHYEESVSTDILGHFFSDIGSTKQLLDTYRRWSVRCGPFRLIYSIAINLVEWSDPSLNFLLMITWTWICLQPVFALFLLIPSIVLGSIYYTLLITNGVVELAVPGDPGDTHPFILKDVNANLWFNNIMMSAWCNMYDKIETTGFVAVVRKALPTIIAYRILLIGAWLSLWILPINIFLLLFGMVPLLITCPLIDCTQDSITANRTTAGQSTTTPVATVEVFENQRWWLGNWSDKGLSIGTAVIHPWSDHTGAIASCKAEIQLPQSTTRWTDLWHVDGEWMYATNFSPSENFHSHQRASDFVRRRRWIRNATG